MRTFFNHVRDIVFPPHKKNCPYCGGGKCFGVCGMVDTQPGGQRQATTMKTLPETTEAERTAMALAEEKDVLISGFGKFVVKRKRARRGRNPQTKESLELRARRVVVFKNSGILRKKVNGEAVDENTGDDF